MRFVLASTLAAFLLTSAAGCGCGGDDDDVPDPPGGPYGDVLLAACGWLDRCPDAVGYPIAYRNRDECAAILSFVLSCHMTEQEVGDDVTIYGIEERRPDVDGDAAEACVAWLEDAGCDALLSSEGTPCSNVFGGGFDDDDDSGSAAVDEPCSYDDACQADLFCQGGSADPETAVVTCQVCKPRVGEGEECAQYSRMCRDELYCRYEEDGPRRCRALDADGARCVENEQCASGFCNYALEELGGWGQCDPGGHEGEPCRAEIEGTGEGSDCRYELFCEAGTCAPRRPNGADCTDDLQCAGSPCDEGAHVCGLPDGSPCTDHYPCASMICVDGACGGPPGACISDDGCPEDEFCAGACRPPNCSCSGSGCPIGTCTPDGAGGGGCADDEECPSGECQDGVCTEPVDLGDPCTEGYECYPRGVCQGGVCVAKAGPGDECAALDSCQEPFLCVDGRCEIMNLVCEPASAGEMCAWLRVCDEDSYCDFFDGVRCKARAHEGDECATSLMRGVETCVAGTTCLADATGTMRCVRRPDLGEPCTGPCIEGSYCFEGTCQADPLGRPCDEYDNPCPAGLICSDDAEVCLPPGGEGARCDDQDECAEGFYCYSYDTCQSRKGRGEECRDTFECAAELYCEWDTYTCQSDVSVGTECDSREAPCAAGAYCPSGMTECTAQGGPGDPCSSNEQCESGVCYSYSWCQAEPGCVIPD